MNAFRKGIVLLSALLFVLLLSACQSAAPEPSSDTDPASEDAFLPEEDVPAPSETSSPEPESSPTEENSSEQTEEDTSAEPETVPAEPPTEPPTDPPTDPPADPVPEKVNNTLYVLMYHSFVPEGTSCNAWMRTDTQFREDLQWLSDHGYTTVLPSELAAGTPLPERAVMLTFDDGYENNYTVAYPILQEFQAKAVISLVVSHQDAQAPGWLTWDMCREMADSGLVEIGSHTYDCHKDEAQGVKRLNGESREDYEARVFADIQSSIDLIEENVGAAVRFFAYPYGTTDKWSDAYLAEHFAVTVTTSYGRSDVSKGLYKLNRCNISQEEPPSFTLPK